MWDETNAEKGCISTFSCNYDFILNSITTHTMLSWVCDGQDSQNRCTAVFGQFMC